MPLYLSIYRLNLPLVKPYHLSLGTLNEFGTYYVVISGEEKNGIGEITPLPGYSHETMDTVFYDLKWTVDALNKGQSFSVIVDALFDKAPFTASGIACAVETWIEGEAVAYEAPVSNEIPMTAYCPGESPHEAIGFAKKLAADGYVSLKMKIGTNPIVQDIDRIKAVSKVLPKGVKLRIDANQAYTYSEGVELSHGVAGLPIDHFEQPFKPDEWEEHEKLAANTEIPILLDESISSMEDIKKARDCGASAVKLKLCKHKGLSETKELIKKARELGLGVVFGNGVQSAVGNHLEARIHSEQQIETASESNGFLKILKSPVLHHMIVAKGMLKDNGLEHVGIITKQYESIIQTSVKLTQIEN